MGSENSADQLVDFLSSWLIGRIRAACNRFALDMKWQGSPIIGPKATIFDEGLSNFIGVPAGPSRGAARAGTRARVRCLSRRRGAARRAVRRNRDVGGCHVRRGGCAAL